MYREITLKNNVIVLSVTFVYHTELQNFLIAPRMVTVAMQFCCNGNCAAGARLSKNHKMIIKSSQIR